MRCPKQARLYDMKDTSGELTRNDGQIITEHLKAQGVDVLKLQKRKTDNQSGQIRKTMKRSAGGEVTLPRAVTNEKLKQKLNQKIVSGEHNFGYMIIILFNTPLN